ncbi:MAG TPA: hypothetical protein VHH09_01205 [Acidimicrobiales bacterium]|nr:hypothetical protein [Acidimicrobiales bacterium]
MPPGRLVRVLALAGALAGFIGSVAAGGLSGGEKAAKPAVPDDGRPTGVDVFARLGTWVDVFDFNPAHADGEPSVSPDDVDGMAAAGIRTLYLQAARSQDRRAPDDLTSPALLGAFLQRAHAKGIAVVAWYLPYLSDLADDRRHLEAIVEFRAEGHRFDGVALDIEWRAGVRDPVLRSDRLVELSVQLRELARGLPVGAIVLPPVLTDVVNTGYWPRFPWDRLRRLYDAWLPMSYWTDRGSRSPYADAYRYTADNVRMVREHLGDPAATVHAIGGIGDESSTDDYRDFLAACADTDVVGYSIYDWDTTDDTAWAVLRP